MSENNGKEEVGEVLKSEHKKRLKLNKNANKALKKVEGFGKKEVEFDRRVEGDRRKDYREENRKEDRRIMDSVVIDIKYEYSKELKSQILFNVLYLCRDKRITLLDLIEVEICINREVKLSKRMSSMLGVEYD